MNYGAFSSIRTLARELKRRGHDVQFVAFTEGPIGPGMAEEFPLHQVPARGKFDMKAVRALARLFREERPDIVHTHLSAASFAGCLAARMSGVHSVATVHGMNRSWSYLLAEHLIAVSEAGRENLLRQLVPKKKVSVAYNGVEIPAPISYESRSAARATLGIPEGALVVGTTARAHKDKGIHIAVQAVSRLRNEFPTLRYVVVGEGEYLELLRRTAEALGVSDRIMFLGFRGDVDSILPAFDIFVLPTFREAMGISVVEAMAAGLPVIASYVGGIPEVISDGTGVLVPPHNVDALEGSIRALLQDETRRNSLARAARARAAHVFSTTACCDAVLRAYSLANPIFATPAI